MNLFAVTLSFILCAHGNVKADTTDYWHVVYNNKTIAEYPVYPKNPPVVIEKTKVKANDTLTVTYGSDTPCWDCTSGIYIFDRNKKKIILSSSKGETIFKCSVKKIISIMNGHHYVNTNVYYFDGRRNNLIFLLTIR